MCQIEALLSGSTEGSMSIITLMYIVASRKFPNNFFCIRAGKGGVQRTFNVTLCICWRQIPINIVINSNYRITIYRVSFYIHFLFVKQG